MPRVQHHDGGDRDDVQRELARSNYFPEVGLRNPDPPLGAQFTTTGGLIRCGRGSSPIPGARSEVFEAVAEESVVTVVESVLMDWLIGGGITHGEVIAILPLSTWKARAWRDGASR